MSQTQVTNDYSEPDGICESYWGRNKCPNKAEFIIKCTENNGFSIMCEVHKDSYISTTVDGYIIEPYDLEKALEYLEILKKEGIYKKMENNIITTDEITNLLDIDLETLKSISSEELLKIIGKIVSEGLYGLLACLDVDVLEKVGNIAVRLHTKNGEYTDIILSDKILKDQRKKEI